MTDNEIKKALECCSMSSYPACRDCPYHEQYNNHNCITKRNDDIKDLINRQQAEIEGLKNAGDNKTKEILRHISAIEELQEKIKIAKSEARKEFANEFEKRCIAGGIYPAFVKKQLYNLLKEMEGETNGTR